MGASYLPTPSEMYHEQAQTAAPASPEDLSRDIKLIILPRTGSVFERMHSTPEMRDLRLVFAVVAKLSPKDNHGGRYDAIRDRVNCSRMDNDLEPMPKETLHAYLLELADKYNVIERRHDDRYGTRYFMAPHIRTQRETAAVPHVRL